ncbi:MAG: HAD-IA family hydrolase [Clostridia bacterium]|nr:HAD-IA family hydrolase [Clostridia bacterium]
MAHAKYKTILFDLDGTLIDSKPGILTSIRKTLDAFNIPYTEEIIDGMVGPPFRVSMKEMLGIGDMSVIEQLITFYRTHYKAGDWRDCKIYDGVVEMLTTLREKGYTLGLATSKPLQYTTIIMEELGLDKYFHYVGGATGDATSELKTDVINNVLMKLGVKDLDSVLMIGDRLYDIEGAKSSGVDSMGILWGYGDRAEHENCGADFILSTPSEVVEFLK